MGSSVATPLWLSDPVKMACFSYKPGNTTSMISSETVATSMVSLVKKGEYSGDTVLEVSASRTRTIGVFNVDPPQGEDTKVLEDVLEENYKPIFGITGRERATGNGVAE